MAYSDCCDWSKCTRCGECLIKCPVIDIEKDEAQFEISQLIKGEEAPHVFNQCTLCFNCNNYCPVEGLRPHELIQQRMLEHRGKVPEYIKYFLNGMPAPTFWDDVYGQLSFSERDILRQWSEIPPPSKEILWVGCMGRMSCYDINNSEVFKNLPKFGPPDLCCGELHYRLGGWDAYVDIIEKTLNRFDDLDIERMVCYCGSCYNYLSNILPRVYGKDLPFEPISIYQWLWEKVDKGELELKRPLKFRAAVSESCYVSELGPEFPKTLRKLYKAAGMEIVELEHHGNNNLTCGTVSMARKSNFPSSFLTMVREQKKKYKEVKNAGVKDMALNCPGCFLTLCFTNYLFGKRLRYMPDELLSAFGDNIQTPIRKRFPLFLKALFKRMPRFLIHEDYTELPRIQLGKPKGGHLRSKATPSSSSV